MRDSLPRIGLWLPAGFIAVVLWLVVATIVGNDHGDPFAVLAPIVALGVLACPVGWRSDRAAAFAILIGGIGAAAAVAWAAGAVGVAPDANPLMRSSYHATLVIIDTAIAAVVGSFTVLVGYQLGGLLRRVTGRASDPL